MNQVSYIDHLCLQRNVEDSECIHHPGAEAGLKVECRKLDPPRVYTNLLNAIRDSRYSCLSFVLESSQA